MNKQDKISSKINLIKLAANNPIVFELDSETEWVKEFLIEMNENASEKTPEEYLNETSIFISGEMEKKNKPSNYDFLKSFIPSYFINDSKKQIKSNSSLSHTEINKVNKKNMRLVEYFKDINFKNNNCLKLTVK
jgi:hypothetical protein